EMQALSPADTLVSGQFDPGILPYEYDGPYGTIPHLSEMTETALNILGANPKGFFLLVEGGKIDKAAHRNQIERNIFETIEFDRAVQQAAIWADGRTDTLIVVVADHETGGLAVDQCNEAGTFPGVTWAPGSEDYRAGGHTAANVNAYAWGKLSERLPDVLDNTYFFNMITNGQ
ncbi:unnamed protein product, partial [marine sediment metagenome]